MGNATPVMPAKFAKGQGRQDSLNDIPLIG